MISLAETRWAALRRLFETYGADVPTLAAVAGVKEKTLLGRAAKEDWGTLGETHGAKVHSLLERVIVAFDTQIAGLMPDGEYPADDKAARSLAVLAKTLETIAGVSKSMDQETDTRGRARQHGSEGAGNDGLADREEISRIIGQLAQRGED